MVRVKESQFADDTALYAGSRERLELMTPKFVEEASKWGLAVSLVKTKLGNGCEREFKVCRCHFYPREGW